MTAQPPPNLDEMTVGEIAATVPGATAVFREFNMDFCCHGDVALAKAALQRGLDVSDVTYALQALEASDAQGPASRDTDQLIDHILIRYHETHRRELAELVALADKVEKVHASHPDAPHGLASLLHRMRGELEVHMKKEELILFPAMRRGVNGLADPIAQMRHDHDEHGEHLQRLGALTNGLTLPEDACRSWHALYAGLSKLTEDLMEHIHLENNVLFPRFQQASVS
jgi:regulator of cell morphogenesis and NO signaling